VEWSEFRSWICLHFYFWEELIYFTNSQMISFQRILIACLWIFCELFLLIILKFLISKADIFQIYYKYYQNENENLNFKSKSTNTINIVQITNIEPRSPLEICIFYLKSTNIISNFIIHSKEIIILLNFFFQTLLAKFASF
jgi:hypothetical protein